MITGKEILKAVIMGVIIATVNEIVKRLLDKKGVFDKIVNNFEG